MARRERITIRPTSVAASALARINTRTQQLMHLSHPPLLLFPLRRVSIALYAHHLAQVIRQPGIGGMHRPLNIRPEVQREFLHPAARGSFLLRTCSRGIVTVGDLVEVPDVHLLLPCGEHRGLDDRNVQVRHFRFLGLAR